MSTLRAYTWGVVSYASLDEIQPLLDKAKHWAYCVHDKDTIIDDTGKRVPKETHTHIIVTFEDEQSQKQVRSMVNSNQNTLAQPLKNTIRRTNMNGESVRGLWKYLIHEDQDPEEKYLYDTWERKCDDLEYWQHRCKEEADAFAKDDSFFEDLTSSEFSVEAMGRKYGRDFMKNINHYLAYRSAVINEREWAEERKREEERVAKWEELEQFCLENCLEFEELKNGLYFTAMQERAKRERNELFNKKQKTE